MADSSQKTEQPTGRHLQKAREQGQFVTSREFVTGIQFLTYISVAISCFPGWLTSMKDMLRSSLAGAFHANLNVATFPVIAQVLLDRAMLPIFLVGGITVVVTLGVHLSITKLGLSANKLVPDLSRLNPAGKIKNIFQQGPMSALQACAMLVVFSWVTISIARQNAESFLSLPFVSLEIGLSKVGASLKDILWKAAGLFVVFGAIDLFRQKKRFMKQHRMSKQEIKEEFKESEGNPQIKSKIRRLQRDLLRRNMMKNVATATAVIVNPTHYAVAVRYNHETMAAPVVVAKGKNYLALRIRQRATEHGIPLVENKPLAQALYKSVDVGREIPPHLYRAVAEVLAYIYKVTKGR